MLPPNGTPGSAAQLNAQDWRLTDMWWWRSGPRTDAELRKEIGRLEGARDRILASAPCAFVFQRLISPVMFAAFLLMVGDTLLFHRDKAGLGFFLFMGGFGFVVGGLVYKSWINAPAKADLRGISDRLGYEGDSPRDIQAKIDRMRAQLGRDTPPNS